MVKEGFVLRKMPGMNLIMPTGANAREFNGTLMLNDTGVVIYEGLAAGKSADEIAEALTEEYDVAFDKAKSDVEKTVNLLKEAGVLAE